MGIYALGIYALGIHALGIHALGIYALGIYALGISNSTPKNNAPLSYQRRTVFSLQIFQTTFNPFLLTMAFDYNHTDTRRQII